MSTLVSYTNNKWLELLHLGGVTNYQRAVLMRWWDVLFQCVLCKACSQMTRSLIIMYYYLLLIMFAPGVTCYNTGPHSVQPTSTFSVDRRLNRIHTHLHQEALRHPPVCVCVCVWGGGGIKMQTDTHNCNMHELQGNNNRSDIVHALYRLYK